MNEASREPEILGIFLVLQNALCALEALDGAGALVERALLRIPGLRAARVKLGADLSLPLHGWADGMNRTLSIATIRRSYGHVEVELTNEAAFRPYEPFVYNMTSTLALLLENRSQRRQLQTELSRREELVLERTSALCTSNALRDLALDAAKLGEWDLDLTTHRVRRNRRHDLMFGYDPMLPEWTYELFLEHVHPEDRSEVDACVQHAIRSGEDYNAEFRIHRADGAVRWLWSRASVLRESNASPAHFLGFVQDITDKKQAEEEREALLAREQRARQQAEEATRIKDQFLATVSHELRTPLTAVLGWVTILRGVGGTEPLAMQKGLEIIERNARAQARIVEDILDMSRIVTGKLRIEPQAVNLDAVLRDTMEVVGPSVAAKRLSLRYSSSEDPCFVFGDPARLQQIVWNLLSNATKFTPKAGRIDVMLSLEAETVSLRVSDSGVGIAQECLPYVFERFWQADASMTRAYGGLGLGLAIVRHLVELHGGSIEVESDGVGHGAIFNLKLPAHRCGGAVTKEETAPMPPSSLVRARVLVVDDEEDTREMLRVALPIRGAAVETAASAAEALYAIEQFHPNVLISDIGMPVEDGYALIRRVRESGILPHQLPAVALTAYARSEDVAEALAAGFQAHVAKPVDATMLARVIVGLLGADLHPQRGGGGVQG